jgi:hypothetical protein
VKDLRDWFCQEMNELGVPDRYVNAFWQDNTVFSPEKLKEIYYKANFKVLG